MWGVEREKLNYEHNMLTVRVLCKYAENGVFWPNISFVEKKRVVLTIDCWGFWGLSHGSETTPPHLSRMRKSAVAW